MKREGTLFGDPPIRSIVGVTELVGPRGGVTYVLSLSCEHWTARRKLPPKTEVPCVGCLVEAALRAKRAGRSMGTVK